MTTLGRTASLLVGIRSLVLAVTGGTVVMGPLNETPDAAIGLTPYAVDSDAWIGSGVDAVQVLIRGAKTAGIQPVLNLQDLVFGALTALDDTAVSGVPVTLCWRQASAPLSPDASGRPEIRDTYYLRTDRASAA